MYPYSVDGDASDASDAEAPPKLCCKACAKGFGEGPCETCGVLTDLYYSSYAIEWDKLEWVCVRHLKTCDDCSHLCDEGEVRGEHECDDCGKNVCEDCMYEHECDAE